MVPEHPDQPRPAPDRLPVSGRDPRQSVKVTRFAEALLDLNRPSIERQAAALLTAHTPPDDVAWWEATTALNRALRPQQTGRQAAMATHRALQAVLAAASRTGLSLSTDILAVARSAGRTPSG